MADADVQITAGTGTKVDTRTVGAGGDEHRQVIVIGDPTVAANVATVWQVTDGFALATVNLRENGTVVDAEAPAARVTAADGRANTAIAFLKSATNIADPLASAPHVFNGTTWDRMRGDTAGLFAQGNVAHDAVDSGNPVKIGGKTTASVDQASVAAGDRVDAQFDGKGRQGVFISSFGGTTGATVVSPNDAVSSGNSLATEAFSAVFNGVNWDRQRTASADALAATGIAAAGLMGYNGTAWDRVRVANTGRLQVDVVSGGTVAQGGDVAHDAVDSGNPVKVGGVYKASPTAVASGDRTEFLTDSSGRQIVSVSGINAVTDINIESQSTTLAVGGDFGHDAADIGNPIKVGGRADAAFPTAVASGDRVNAHFDVHGHLGVWSVPHEMGGLLLTAKTAQYTTAQTGTALWTPAAGKRVVATSIQIQSGGTTAGTCIVWFGASGDTTYTRGTDLALFDGEFAPSATSKPGFALAGGVTPIGLGANDHVLRVTTTNAQTVTVTVWGYEV